MLTNRQLFFQHMGLPSQTPSALEIVKAEGIYMWDNQGVRYVDLVSGVSVSNIGHRHPKVVEAIKAQVDQYMHLMVYGEYVQSPQVQLAGKLASLLPDSLKAVYFVNSGSEAIEGALKLAKRYTGRTEIFAYKDAYHGATHGALSILGSESMKYAFRPLLPDIHFLDYNNFDQIERISEKTACVVIEPIQAEAGIILPAPGYLKALREKCNQTGTLLVYDEVQMGFGRTGKLFCFENENIVPDIMCIAKGMGGGMPIGAFISSNEIMKSLTFNPVLGHITTFGGHPVSAAAALANINVIVDEKLSESAEEKGNLFLSKLAGLPGVKEIRSKGLMLAVEMDPPELASKMIQKLLDEKMVVDPFLFNRQSFRIAPPLTITMEQIEEISEIIKKCILSFQ